MRDDLWKKAAGIGVSVLVVGAGLKGISWLAGWDGEERPGEAPKHVPWPVWLFATGVTTHLAREITGRNRRYCEMVCAQSTNVNATSVANSPVVPPSSASSP